ncbi:PH domain-containing protein [Candidatus Berkelbacteria bacterium]|nr:PH domain-containing protein [Candidatus Berkelbacteria bacterium]
MAKAQQRPTVSYLIIRKSAVFLAAQLLTIELVFLLAAVLFLWAGPSLVTVPAGVTPPVIVGIGVTAALTSLLIKLILVLGAILVWVNEFYEIRHGEILHHYGVIARHRQVYSTRDVKAMVIDQDMGGRLFRYGTIHLHNPALEAPIVLEHIPNPNRCQTLIAEFLPEIEGKTTFLRPGGVATS